MLGAVFKKKRKKQRTKDFETNQKENIERRPMPVFLFNQDLSAWLWNLYRTISKILPTYCTPVK